jgi:hypothetical protein
MKLPIPVVFWNESTQQYTVATNIPVDQWCNGWTAINRGTTICIVNGDPLNPGESKDFGGNLGEIYEGRIDISFKVQVPPPLVITNLAVVTQKFYTGGRTYDNLKM